MLVQSMGGESLRNKVAPIAPRPTEADPRLAFIEIENFKCFGNRVRIPLAPITLLYGENSAGKSAISQLLCLLKQTLDLVPENVPLVSQDPKGLVDLGHYQDYIHDHNIASDLSVGFGYADGQGYEFAAGYDDQQKQTVLRRWIEYDKHHRWEANSLSVQSRQIVANIPCGCAGRLAEYASKHVSLVRKGFEKMLLFNALCDADPLAKMMEGKGSLGPDHYELCSKRDLASYHEAFRSAVIDHLQVKTAIEAVRERHAEFSALLLDEDNGQKPDLWNKYCCFDIQYDFSQWRCRATNNMSEDHAVKLPLLANCLLLGCDNVHIVPTCGQDEHDGSYPTGWAYCNGTGVRVEQLPDGTTLDADKVKNKFPGIDWESRRGEIRGRGEECELHLHGYSPVASDVVELSFLDQRHGRLLHGNCDVVAARDDDEHFFRRELSLGVIIVLEDGSSMALTPCQAEEMKELKCIEKIEVGLNRDDLGFQNTDMPDTISRIVSLGPLRAEPSRWYEVYSTPPQSAGRKGEHTAEILRLHPELMKLVNEWLAKLGVDYGVQVDTVEPGLGMPSLAIFRLVDNRRKDKEAVKVTMADVGMGISQILPIVVEILHQKAKWILIEQPELHIHPRLQAELGTLFASAYKDRGHQIIAETHSEHLLLRIRRLIRNGVLSPKDVAVLYVERNAHGSAVSQLRLNAHGAFIDPWPLGFFPERLDEILGE